MSSFIIPNNVLEIEEAAFANCTSLTSIMIPEGVKTIGWKFSYDKEEYPNNNLECVIGAFQNCTSLAYVNLPKSLTEISCNTF